MAKILKIAVVGKDCVACGSCIKVCKKGAVKVPTGVRAVVDSTKCVGCGMCAKVCPADIITITEREAE